MSIYSARRMLGELESNSGYCIPFALDSIMRNTELPREFYDYLYENHHHPDSSHNRGISFLLEEFFKITPEPSTDLAPIAKFHAFGSSPQAYMPDIMSDAYSGRLPIMEKFGITEKQLRLQELLKLASKKGCNVLFSNFHPDGEHVSGLEVIDPGAGKFAAAYVVRDWTHIQNKRVYGDSDLAGINQVFQGVKDNFTPLPEGPRPQFPDGQSSWELIILPPEPGS